MNPVILLSSLAVASASPEEVRAATPMTPDTMSLAVYQYVAGCHFRLVAHENAHRLSILQAGGDAHFDTGDTDPRKYAANHPLMKPGFTQGHWDHELSARQLFGFHSAGLNAETRLAEATSNPFLSVPARLSALLYSTKGELSDFSQMGISQRKAALLQTAALVASCGGPQVYVYFNPEGTSLKATRALGVNHVSVESTGSHTECSIGRTFTFDGGVSITPSLTTNGHSQGVALAANYRCVSLEAFSHNPRTLSGFRNSYGASHSTVELNLTIQQRF